MKASLAQKFDQAGQYSPGHGHLQIQGYVTPNTAGGAVDYAHQITRTMSAFATGWGGVSRNYDGNWKRDFGALGGIRWQW